jgi:hypothetical protein
MRSSIGMGRVLALTVVLSVMAVPSPARDRAPLAARSGLDLATAAARAWAADAVLLYVENDEAVDGAGLSMRWGYLFHSPTLAAWRGYSVREDRIVVAEDPGVRLAAPPLAAPWIDSDAALAAADAERGVPFRRAHGGEVRTMVLMRGAFADQDPDAATWTVIYAAPGVPSLFVVVDAADGKVRRTWRG